MAKRQKQKQEEKEILQHVLIPLHEKCSQEEKKKVLERYHADLNEFPKISINDPAIRHLSVKPGDLIKITRKDPKAGISIYYRVVINE